MSDGTEPGHAVAILVDLSRLLSANDGTGRVWEACPDPDANRLLGENPFAFLLAVLADYGVPAERAWQLPSRLRKHLGHLDPARIAAMPFQELEDAIRQIPQGHRFPGEVARYFIAGARKVATEYRGDAARIWQGRNVHDALLHLDAFPGIGQKKGSMAVNILCRDLGWVKPEPEELSVIDVSYDVHVRRVFLRAGFVERDTMPEVLDAARRLNPAYPGELDLGAWHIGRTWCRPTEPECTKCPLVVVCPKLISRNPEAA